MLEESKTEDMRQNPEAQNPEAQEPEERPTRGLEGFYEHFRGVPLKYLDAFIICCFAMLIAVVIFGVLKAR